MLLGEEPWAARGWPTVGGCQPLSLREAACAQTPGSRRGPWTLNKRLVWFQVNEALVSLRKLVLLQQAKNVHLHNWSIFTSDHLLKTSARQNIIPQERRQFCCLQQHGCTWRTVCWVKGARGERQILHDLTSVWNLKTKKKPNRE